MPKFAANLTTMFTEYDMPERFRAAAECGFDTVEMIAPYPWPVDQVAAWLEEHQLSMILINTPSGDSFGSASLSDERFVDDFSQALGYARKLDIPMVHVMAGQGGDKDTFLKNLIWASNQVENDNITLMLEPLNHQDVPDYLYHTSDQTAQLIKQLNQSNIKLQFDFYHLQITEGNLLANLKRHWDIVGHIQFSSVPGRHEPQYGEINIDFLLDELDALGYDGYVGCEYKAKSATIDGLSWANRFGLGNPPAL